jgi:hypothetical protein
MHLASYFWNKSSLATAAGAPAVPATFLSLTTTPSGTTIDIHLRDVHGLMHTILNGSRTRIE